MLHASAERYGHRVAIESSEATYTYAELAQAVSRASAALIALGITPGDRVAIWAPNHPFWIVSALAIHSTGAVLVPLNTRYRRDEAMWILNKSGARVLFTVEGFLGKSFTGLLRQADPHALSDQPVRGLESLEHIVIMDGPSAAGTHSWSSFDALGQEVAVATVAQRARSVTGDDLSDLLFTSGTTGHPKGVMTTHAQNLKVFGAWTHIVGLNAEDRYLIVNPFFHAFGYKAGWLACLLRGATVLPHAVFDPEQVMRRIYSDQISVLPGPPALYQALLAHPERPQHDLSSLRLAVTGAAVIPVSLIHAMRDILGFDTVITGYGLTEVCGVATMCRLEDDPTTVATTSGRALPDVEVAILNPQGDELPPGQPGEIVVRGYNVMRGYFNDPEQTQLAVDNLGWLHTGDIGVLDESGNIRITDRLKDMYIMGGFNCYPAEIETLLAEHPAIAEVAIIGVPHPQMGEVGMAFIVPVNPEVFTPADVLPWCRDHMANFKAPRHIQVVDELPRNALGKVQKFILRKRVQAEFSAQTLK